ncbi:MAG: hypothetical protein ACOVQH_09495 [Burkholderiaceae bacterium]
MSAVVYKIAKWSTLYENNESRKIKKLQWVPVPIGFDSSGYQALLDHFGERAPALYGTWIGLVAIAANCHDRGILRNSRGIPLTISHLARMTGFDAGLFSELFAWASSPEVGWLETEPSTDVTEQQPKTDENPVVLPSSGNSPGDLPAIPEKTVAELNRTRRELEGNINKKNTRGENFETCWARWKKHLGQIQKPLSPITEEMQLMQLDRIFPDDADAIAAVEYSILVQAKNLILNGDHAKPSNKPKPANHKLSDDELFSKVRQI